MSSNGDDRSALPGDPSLRLPGKPTTDSGGPRQSGGVNIHGGTVDTGSGDIVGRDNIVSQDFFRELEAILRPLTEAISAAPQEKRAEAMAKLDELKKEMAKGSKHDDGVAAKLVDGLVGLVPTAASAVVGAFGTPILSGISGPVTKYVLEKIQSK
jgi:hypothetical protein